MPAFRHPRDPRGGLDERFQDGGQSPVTRAVTGFLLGLLAGAVAAFVTPRRQQPSGPARSEAVPVP